jgi:hypothetical protein
MAKEEDEKDRKGVTRRGFLQIVGAGAIASTATGEASPQPAAKVEEPAEMTRVKLLVNGRRHRQKRPAVPTARSGRASRGTLPWQESASRFSLRMAAWRGPGWF